MKDEDWTVIEPLCQKYLSAYEAHEDYMKTSENEKFEPLESWRLLITLLEYWRAFSLEVQTRCGVTLPEPRFD